MASARTRPVITTLLQLRKQQILDRSMDTFERNLDQWLERLPGGKKRARADDDAGDDDAGEAAAGDGVRARVVERQIADVRTRSTRGKQGGDSGRNAAPSAAAAVNDFQHDGGGDDGGHGAQDGAKDGASSKKRQRREKKPDTILFACPFWAHDPAQYAKVKTCCGPGWDMVHRVKEHIYRRHSLKNVCLRCYRRFDVVADLQAHQREEQQCRKSRDNAVPGVVSDEQEKTLRRRAKAKATSDEERWGETYRIIFPNEKKIPSPYYHQNKAAKATSEVSLDQQKVNDSSSDDDAEIDDRRLAEYKAYLRRELPRLVRARLEQELEKLLLLVQDRLTDRAAEICDELFGRLTRTFAAVHDSSRQQQQQQQQQQQRSLASIVATAPIAAAGSFEGSGGTPASGRQDGAVVGSADPGVFGSGMQMPSWMINPMPDLMSEILPGDGTVPGLWPGAGGGGVWDINAMLESAAATGGGLDCGLSNSDSAYYTSSTGATTRGMAGGVAVGDISGLYAFQ